MTFSTLYNNAQIATMTSDKPYGLIENGAVVISAGMIQWVGPEKYLPEEFRSLSGINLEGRLLTPALIDCHTHLVYGLGVNRRHTHCNYLCLMKPFKVAYKPRL